MARLLVLGAGLGGLSTAMLLARDGHEVTVLERDASPPPNGADQAWESWQRRGVNQFRLPHYMLPRWWAHVRAELPEVEPALRECGAAEYNAVIALPESRRGAVREADSRFDTLTARRPMLEAVFASAAQAIGVAIRRGVMVRGVAVDGARSTPRVTGVTTSDGVVNADLVVDCGGRRSAMPAWLAKAGVRPPQEEKADCGFVYYARHFRSADGAYPTLLADLHQLYDSLSTVTLPADNGTWSVVFVTSSKDKQMRGLRDTKRWHAVARLYPLVAHWADAEPITGVDVIAGIEDRHRSYLRDGEPVATGVVAVGDAWACTNPSLGRGTSMGMIHATLLRDLLREVEPADHDKLARRFGELTAQEIEPLYRATLWFDANRLAEIDADIAGAPYRPVDGAWAVGRMLHAASLADPELTRAYATISSFLAPASDVLAGPGIRDRVMSRGAGTPQYPLPGPTREALLAVLG